MKKLLVIPFFICGLTAFSIGPRTFYISSSGDNTTGLSPATAWINIEKLNSKFSTLISDDSVLFNRGETFYGTIRVNKSGTTGHNIVIGCYGTGSKPILTGMSTVSGWISIGINKWESSTTSSNKNNDIVLFGGEQKAPARYPNYTYIPYQTFTSSSVTSSGLNVPTPNYTGGELVMRAYRWIMDRRRILNHVSHTLTTSITTAGVFGKANAGLFIQKDFQLADVNYEWILDTTTLKIKTYSTTIPSNVTISTLDTIISIGAFTNITIRDLQIEGGRIFGLWYFNSLNITIKNCDIRNCGTYALYAWNTPNITVDSSTIKDILGIGCFIRNNGVPSANITNNDFNRIGWLAGLGTNVDDSYSAIVVNGNNNNIKQNRIDSVGYKGISFQGNNVTIENNYITKACIIKDDGGAIYTWTRSTGGTTVYTNRKIIGNVIENTTGAAGGSIDNTTEAHSIYLDGESMNIDVIGNTIIGGAPGDAGIFMNNTSNIRISDNHYYNGNIFMSLNRLPNDLRLRNITVTSNTSVPITSNFFYWNGRLWSPDTIAIADDMKNIFVNIDSNYYKQTSNSFDWFYHIKKVPPNQATDSFVNPASQTLCEWKSTIENEVNSQLINQDSSFMFYSNPTTTATTQNFIGYSKEDERGNVYNDSAVISRYSSLFLFDNGFAPIPGVNIPPIANAGEDQIITLPTNFAILDGSLSSDADGTITYEWRLGGVILGTSSIFTSTSLTEGVYNYVLTVMDNNGATATDNVTVTVLPIIIPPSSEGRRVILGRKFRTN